MGRFFRQLQEYDLPRQRNRLLFLPLEDTPHPGIPFAF